MMTLKQLWIWVIVGFMGICAMGTTIIMLPNGETIVLAVMIGSMLLSVFGFIIYDEIVRRRMNKAEILHQNKEHVENEVLVAEKLRRIENADRWFQKAEQRVLFSVDAGSCFVYVITAILFLSILMPVFIRARQNAAERNHVQMNNSTINVR